MAIAIDREEAGNILNPSFEVINWCVQQHQSQLARLQMLSDYYDGLPHKVDETTTTRTPHDKDEVYVNNAKYVTDMMVGFTVGAPISYAPPKDEDMDDLQFALDRMRVKKHDKELAKDISVMGVGLELQYLAFDPNDPSKTMPKITTIDPRGMFLVVDDTIERTKLFAVRYKEKQTVKGESYWEFNIFTAKHAITYKSKELDLSEGSLLDKPKVKEHYYGEVPVTEYRNNEEKQGDFEHQISQIDAYNKLMTGRIKDKENFIKAVMILYGFTLPEEKPDKIGENMVINAPAKEDGGDAEYLTNTMNEREVQVLADALLDDFHKTSYVPNLNDENFAGQASGVAMKYKLFGLLLIIATKIGYMEDGLTERLRMLNNVVGLKGKKLEDVEAIKITFKPNLPIDRSEIIEQISNSMDFLPLTHSLSWLDDVDNPQDIIEQLQAEKEESIKLNAKAFGVMNEHSHSDLEDDDDDTNNDKKELPK